MAMEAAYEDPIEFLMTVPFVAKLHLPVILLHLEMMSATSASVLLQEPQPLGHVSVIFVSVVYISPST